MAAAATPPALPPLEEEWKVDYANTDPLDVAVLYDFFKNPSKCGHAVPLQLWMQRQQQSLQQQHTHTHTPVCPMCQAPVSFCSNDNKRDDPVVLFKYNKLTVRLTVPKNHHQQRPLVERPWWQSWLVLVPLQAGARATTAQGRIAEVLNMPLAHGIKILAKGKVLYPNPTQTADQISETLLKLSLDETKVSLLVMGTVRGYELTGNPDSDNNKQQPWWQWTLETAATVVVLVWQAAWHGVSEALTAGRHLLQR